MKTNIFYISLIIVFSVGAYLLGSNTHRVPSAVSNSAVEALDFSADTPYMALTFSQCPNNTNVSDEFVCINDLASTTLAQADALANKLITKAPVRLKEVLATKRGTPMPMSWEYGGEDFLRDLPNNVQKAQKARDGYFDAVCNLDEMYIYGGSGMDLEREACRYYYAEQYLQVLKKLEGGITASQ